jgi:hypothetical protein
MKNLNGQDNMRKLSYGWLVEFKNPEPLVKAAHVLFSFGIRHMDAFTPYPLEDLPEAIGFTHENVGLFALLGGIGGGVFAFAMQTYANVIDYPLNVGGRPYYSWPAFIPVTFELMVLGAALSAAFGMLALNKLPTLWHPLFNSEQFLRASKDRFFLCLKSRDPKFELQKIQAILGELEPLSMTEVIFEE